MYTQVLFALNELPRGVRFPSVGTYYVDGHLGEKIICVLPLSFCPKVAASIA